MTNMPLHVGKSVSISRTVTEKDIEAFAILSLDKNLVHFDEDFASKTIFGKRIAHGMVGAALISGALTDLMGDGNIWLSVSVKFEKPVYIDDELTCILTINDINRRGIATINVEVSKETGEIVVSGSVQSMRFVTN